MSAGTLIGLAIGSIVGMLIYRQIRAARQDRAHRRLAIAEISADVHHAIWAYVADRKLSSDAGLAATERLREWERRDLELGLLEGRSRHDLFREGCDAVLPDAWPAAGGVGAAGDDR